MDSSKSPQHDEKSLFLRGSEVVLCEALKKLSETGGRGQIQIMTYTVQNLDT